MVCIRMPNGDLRMCIDPKDLNNNKIREYYQIPTRDEITSEMAGSKYFSKLDAPQGFWQLELHEESIACSRKHMAFTASKGCLLEYALPQKCTTGPWGT